jgi:xanthine/uracil permease
MKWKTADMRICINLISALILMAGLVTAIYIYQTADTDASGVLGYQIIGGTIYPIMPENTKIYKHDLEVYGGKAAVLADDFRRWFNGLWHGKSLAFTIAVITILISFVGFFTARHLSSHTESDTGAENNQDRH